MIDRRRPWPESRPLHGFERPPLVFRLLAALGGLLLVGGAFGLLAWAALGEVSW